MGNVFLKKHHNYFPVEQLLGYSECTYFTTQEINKLYGKFSSIADGRISDTIGDHKTRLSFGEIQSLPDLKECPFVERVCEVFSTGRRRGLNFEDFLDMMSVFSHRAPWNLKAAYAFKIFDFNNDTHICKYDIEKAILCLTGN